MREACQGLVKIYQPKSRIKQTYEPFFFRPQDQQAQDAEENMKTSCKVLLHWSDSCQEV
jgi:hypothetical protein